MFFLTNFVSYKSWSYLSVAHIRCRKQTDHPPQAVLSKFQIRYMHTKLLHIILLINAVWLMSSCSSHEPAEDGPGTGPEVTFIVSDQSRASVTSDLNRNGSGFAIYGDMKFKDYPQTKIFDNTIVRYLDGKWRYDNPQYWFPQHEHSFIAMHPVATTVDGISDTQYSDSRLSFEYTLPDDYTSASDLMVATHRRKIEADPAPKALPIALKFCHIMSRVNFQLTNAAAADIVRVSEIKLEGINRTGSFTIIPASLLPGSSQTDDYVFSWTGISNPGDLTANIYVDVPENGTRPLFPDNNALFMIPQPDNTGVIMHITYTLIDEGVDDEQYTLTAETPIGGWEPGKAYTYSLFVEEISKEIYLTVSVKPWQTPTGTGITVPES